MTLSATSTHTRPSQLRPVADVTVFGLGLALLAGPVALAERPAPPAVDRPLYAATVLGFQHFAQDQLPKLIQGQAWDWNGAHFEATRLHSIKKSELVRPRQAHKDYDSAVRGWMVAVIHVKLDGRVRSGRVVATAGYAPDPAGWYSDEVLLFLGNGDSYDFVTGEVV